MYKLEKRILLLRLVTFDNFLYNVLTKDFYSRGIFVKKLSFFPFFFFF